MAMKEFHSLCFPFRYVEKWGTIPKTLFRLKCVLQPTSPGRKAGGKHDIKQASP